MSRNLLFVSLLLATGVVLADELPEDVRVPSGSEAQAQEQAVDAQAQTEDVQVPAEEAKEATNEGPMMVSGMSILGNQEAPKSLVIVPWKSSEIGDALGISSMLDDSRQPIDREVFMRALSYYEIRSETTP